MFRKTLGLATIFAASQAIKLQSKSKLKLKDVDHDTVEVWDRFVDCVENYEPACVTDLFQPADHDFDGIDIT